MYKNRNGWKHTWRMIGIYNTHPRCMAEICTYFPNIMYWLNMISCKRWGFSRIYCLHKEELSHLVSTYQYFSAMPWHKRLAGSAYCCVLPWLALLGFWLGFCFAKGEFWAGGSEGTARVTRRWRQIDGRGTAASFHGEVGDGAPLNKQTQQGLRSLILPSLFVFAALRPLSLSCLVQLSLVTMAHVHIIPAPNFKVAFYVFILISL